MDFLGIGFPELILIFIIAMMVFGPQRLPEIAAKIGKTVRDLRNMSQGLVAEWQREITVAARLEELEKTREELAQLKEELRSTQQELSAETSEGVKALEQARQEVEATTAQQFKEASTALKEAGSADPTGDDSVSPPASVDGTGRQNRPLPDAPPASD